MALMINLLNASATGPGPWVNVSSFNKGSFNAYVTSGNATVTIDTSDYANPTADQIISAGVGTINPTSTQGDAIQFDTQLAYVRANITANSAGGTVTVNAEVTHG